LSAVVKIRPRLRAIHSWRLNDAARREVAVQDRHL
jgi:hypothetical protein